jgi:hypothetical protein
MSKKCAFCGEKKRLTGEHVIPNGLIKLYPRENITFSNNTKFKDNKGLRVKDVCHECNNKILSKLDNYGVELIKENFIEEFKADDILEFKYDYDKLSKWLMKIAYNMDRSEKINSLILQKATDYILSKENAKKPKYSLYSGLYVDMTLLGERVENQFYLPLQVVRDPKLLLKGMFYEYRLKSKTEDFTTIALEAVEAHYFFRIGSISFILIIWRDDIDKAIIEENNEYFKNLYPYRELDESGSTYIRRVTDTFSCRNLSVIETNNGIVEADECLKYCLNGKSLYEARKSFEEKISEEQMEKGRLLNEMLVFPKDKTLEKEYEKRFGK